MMIQMVLGQVGKCGHFEVQRIDSPLIQRMARDLHDEVSPAISRDSPNQARYLVSFGCRKAAFLADTSESEARRPEARWLSICRRKRSFDHANRRRFAVRTGYSNERKMRRRVALNCLCRKGHCSAGFADVDGRNGPRRRRAGFLASQNGDGTVLDSSLDKGSSVIMPPRASDEEIAASYPTGILLDIGEPNTLITH
jgi:hypothetical protein